MAASPTSLASLILGISRRPTKKQKLMATLRVVAIVKSGDVGARKLPPMIIAIERIVVQKSAVRW